MPKLAPCGARWWLEAADGGGTADAQHQTLHHAETVVQVDALDEGRGEVKCHGEVQVLRAAVEQLLAH